MLPRLNNLCPNCKCQGSPHLIQTMESHHRHGHLQFFMCYDGKLYGFKRCRPNLQDISLHYPYIIFHCMLGGNCNATSSACSCEQVALGTKAVAARPLQRAAAPVPTAATIGRPNQGAGTALEPSIPWPKHRMNSTSPCTQETCPE